MVELQKLLLMIALKHITVTYEDGISYRIIPMGSMSYASLCAEGNEDEPVEFVGAFETAAEALDGIERHHRAEATV